MKKCEQNHAALIAANDAFDALERIESGIVSLDSFHRIRYLNPACERFFGKHCIELLGQVLHDVMPKPLAEVFSRELSNPKRKSRYFRFEAYLPGEPASSIICRCLSLGDGLTMVIREASRKQQRKSAHQEMPDTLHFRDVLSAAEHIRRFTPEIFMGTDMPDDLGEDHDPGSGKSDMRETVLMLEEQKALLSTVIDHIPAMICFMDASGGVKLVNREFERFIGWSREDLHEKNVFRECFPDPAQRSRFHKWMTGNKAGWRDFDTATRKGEVLPVSWSRVHLTDGSHVVIGIDIPDRKKMERDLHHLAAAIDQAEEGVAMLNILGTIEYSNSAYPVLTGCKVDEIVGQNIYEMAKGNTGCMIHEIVDQLDDLEGRSRAKKITRQMSRGETVDLNLFMSPVRDASGAIVKYVSLVRDITREANLQRHLAQMQKMEALWTLAGGVAHDLKNILMPIMINTELALESMAPDNPSHSFLDDVIKAATFGMDIVKQIVAFSNQDSAQKTKVYLSPVIKESLNLLRSTIPSTIDIDHQLLDDLAVALADPTQIKQVLLNLGSNAACAMREKGGLLHVSLSSIGLKKDEARRISPGLGPGPYVRIRMRDTGHGMDQKTMAQIFDPFFSTKKNREGTGLGLSVVHRIVKDHEGAITVQSIPGEGSTFTVYLPRLTGESVLSERSKTGASLRNEHILLVKDSNDELAGKRQSLSRIGYKVTTMEDPEEALQLFEYCSADYDLLITCDDPLRAGGCRFSQEVTRIKPSMPVILCSTTGRDTLENEAGQMGRSVYLTHPFPLSDLVAGIRSLMRKDG